jgi:hypothetical protein
MGVDAQTRTENRTMPRTLSLTALILTATVASAAPALAQNPQPASPANPTVPMAPPNAPSPPPERIAPPSGNTLGGTSSSGSTGRGDLSNRLSRQQGTITPPNIDPGMQVSPPRNGSATTPVIPPPGSPGGNRSVIPK